MAILVGTALLLIVVMAAEAVVVTSPGAASPTPILGTHAAPTTLGPSARCASGLGTPSTTVSTTLKKTMYLNTALPPLPPLLVPTTCGTSIQVPLIILLVTSTN
jgi:hypothetical protein